MSNERKKLVDTVRTCNQSSENANWSMAAVINRKKYVISLIVVIFLFLLLVYLMSSNTMPSECIFCKIAQLKMPQTNIEVETDEFIIFADIKPASKYHYLAVPKRHIDSLKTLTKADEALVISMEKGLKDFFTSKQIDTEDALFGFHMPPFISVKHLHLHGIAPHSSMSFFSRFMFRPNSGWFKTVDEALRYIKEKS